MNRIALYLLVLPAWLTVNQALANDENQIAITSYIDNFKYIATEEMQRSGIPASIKLAQAILESNAGRSHLAVHGNNHFGIKCGKYWDGKTVMREDDDYANGKLIKSCFRAYPSAEFSFRAHSEFLLDPKKEYRYGFLFQLDPTDYRAWAKGLKKAGYATNPQYPERLISIIERYQLYQFDHPPIVVIDEKIIEEDVKTYEEKISTSTETSIVETKPIEKPKTSTARKPGGFFAGVSTSYIIHVNNNVKHIETEYGDNLETIALETGTAIDDLLCYNDGNYSPTEILEEGIYIYIEPKKNKYSGSRDTYRANKGETTFEISQKFGIKLSKLMKRNKWSDNHQVKGGELVYLKKKKK